MASAATTSSSVVKATTSSSAVLATTYWREARATTDSPVALAPTRSMWKGAATTSAATPPWTGSSTPAPAAVSPVPSQAFCAVRWILEISALGRWGTSTGSAGSTGALERRPGLGISRPLRIAAAVTWVPRRRSGPAGSRRVVRDVGTAASASPYGDSYRKAFVRRPSARPPVARLPADGKR